MWFGVRWKGYARILCQKINERDVKALVHLMNVLMTLANPNWIQKLTSTATDSKHDYSHVQNSTYKLVFNSPCLVKFRIINNEAKASNISNISFNSCTSSRICNVKYLLDKIMKKNLKISQKT